jgi:hypothetical protein
MWFKVFVLLRLPISVFFLLGYIVAFGVLNELGMGVLGALFVVGVYVFLAVTSIKLVRLRKGALRLAGWLLTLETVGVAWLGSSFDAIARRRFDPTMSPVVLFIAVVVWSLPNALAFHKARSHFVEPAKEKPGL